MIGDRNFDTHDHRLRRLLLLSGIYLIITLEVMMVFDPGLKACNGQCLYHYALVAGLCEICHTLPINMGALGLVTARAALPLAAN